MPTSEKSIRNTVISYIKATNSEVRIYQEKGIGFSVCDIMAVTDCLTGYEIKSDFDNYSRLKRQIASYNKFFDRNYIVVGKSHAGSVQDKVPSEWGIICISDSELSILREAKKNKRIDRKKQLGILWELELKNLLVRNGLTSCAQKKKDYIIDKLCESVDDKLLEKQTAEELLRRDYSIYDAVDYTIYNKNDESMHTQNEVVDTLSEMDMSELTLDKWIALYHKTSVIKAEKEKEYTKQARAERTSHAITYKDISVYPGAPWISREIIFDFITHLLGFTPSYMGVEYEPVTGSWRIYDKNSYNHESNIVIKYGTYRYNAFQILEATLNLREIKLFTYGKYDEAETIEALEKQRLILEEFQSWIWTDEDRKWEIEEAYNNMFSLFSKEEYDGSKLIFPQMSKDFALFDYQKDAVQKIISTSNTLLAFDVGAGKTYIMIAAAIAASMKRETNIKGI